MNVKMLPVCIFAIVSVLLIPLEVEAEATRIRDFLYQMPNGQYKTDPGVEGIVLDHYFSPEFQEYFGGWQHENSNPILNHFFNI